VSWEIEGFMLGNERVDKNVKNKLTGKVIKMNNYIPEKNAKKE